MENTLTLKEASKEINRLLVDAFNTKKYDVLENAISECKKIANNNAKLNAKIDGLVKKYNRLCNYLRFNLYKFEITNRGLTISFTDILSSDELKIYNEEYKIHIGLKQAKAKNGILTYDLRFYLEIDKNYLYEILFFKYYDSKITENTMVMVFQVNQQYFSKKHNEISSYFYNLSRSDFKLDFKNKHAKLFCMTRFNLKLEEKILSLINLDFYPKYRNFEQ